MTTMDADNAQPVDHVVDDIPSLLTGEADRATVRRVGSHLRACTDCRDDLVDAVVSHATLRSAARTAPDVATGGRLPFVLPDLPARLDEMAEATPATERVDLGPVFAQIRAEAAGTESQTAPVAVDELAARRGRRVRRALTAAAAVAVIGGGTGVAVATLGGDDGRTVTVSAFDTGTVNATAQVGDGWMKLDASSLKKLSSDQFYEAWLVSADYTGVLALGPLGSDGKASFSVPADVMAQYPTLQVTVQDNNGDPAPSGTSVLRASL
ncbi:hypothetical protein ACXR2U_17315 [Jatrophihabitans sp. YIM 134969]